MGIEILSRNNIAIKEKNIKINPHKNTKILYQ